MVHQSLVSYIQAQQANNADITDIKQVLIQKGWRIEDIDEAILYIKKSQYLPVTSFQPKVEPKPKAIKPKITRPKIHLNPVYVSVLIVISLVLVSSLYFFYTHKNTAHTASYISLPAYIK